VGVSECHKKKQEVDFDLLCLWVPRTDESCNLSLNLHTYHPLELYSDVYIQNQLIQFILKDYTAKTRNKN
jgi:hypothetical protein